MWYVTVGFLKNIQSDDCICWGKSLPDLRPISLLGITSHVAQATPGTDCSRAEKGR